MPNGALHDQRPVRSPMVVVVIAGSIITAITLGVRATMGVFGPEIDTSLGIGIDTFSLTIAGQNLIWGLAQPVAGTIADRFGAARVLVIGALTYSVGLLVMGAADGPAGLHLGGGLIVGLGMSAASFAVVLASMSKLIDVKHRSMALGIATAFGSFGHFLLVPLTGIFIRAYGWRTAMVILAVITVSMLIMVRPLRTGSPASPDPAESGDAVPLRDVVTAASRHRDYLLINCTFFVCGFHVTFIGVHLPKSLTDAGLSSGVAELALAFIGLFNIVGAFGAGVLGAKLNKSRLLSVMYSGRTLAFAGLVLLPVTPVTALGFGALMGIVWLASVPLTSGIVLGQFGVRNAGTLFGFVFLSHQLGAFAGAYGGGLAREITGSYDLWWWLCAALGAAAAVIHFNISEAPAPAATVSPAISAQPPSTP